MKDKEKQVKEPKPRNNAQLILLALVAFAALSWIGLMQTQTSNTSKYEELCAQADADAQKGIYKTAIPAYQQALQMTPDSYELVLKLAEAYKGLGDKRSMLATLDQAIAIDPTKAEPYLGKVDYYIEGKKYSEAIQVIEAATMVKDKEVLSNLRESLRYFYNEKYVSYQEVGDWLNGFAVVGTEGLFGAIDPSGNEKIRLKYLELQGCAKPSSSAAGLFPCKMEEEYFYIDQDGDKYLVGEKAFQFLGVFGSGYAPAKLDNLYGYIDPDFGEHSFEFQFAGSFANGIAAVKKGEAWALIDQSLQPITGYEFDDILVDSNGFCNLYGITAVRKTGKYYLYDPAAKKISQQAFDQIRLPASEKGAVAVCIEGKWGFADRDGKILIDPSYDDAASFCYIPSKGSESFVYQLAPVKVLDKWGYIDSTGKLVIDTIFQEARPFNAKGTAAVKSSSAYWKIVVLSEFDV